MAISDFLSPDGIDSLIQSNTPHWFKLRIIEFKLNTLTEGELLVRKTAMNSSPYPPTIATLLEIIIRMVWKSGFGRKKEEGGEDGFG